MEVFTVSKYFYYPAIFQPEDIGFSVSVPDLPGCFTQGDTLDEALEMTQEAIGIMLEDIPEIDYPTASSPAKILTEGNQFVMMIRFDKLAYDKKYNSKAIKKTLSIPAWLNKLALEKNINFSNTLQNALIRELNI